MIIDILDGGEAEYMGDGIWSLSQRDHLGVVQNVVIEEANVQALQAATPAA
jgi:hypothetical protein